MLLGNERAEIFLHVYYCKKKQRPKKLTVAGKYRGYGIVGSYFGWTFEFRKHNVFCCSVNIEASVHYPHKRLSVLSVLGLEKM